MPNRRNIYFYHTPDSIMVEKVEPLFELAKQYDFNIVSDHRKANIIISIGSDGTFLQAVRKTGFRDDCLYAGISSTGSLNMYCDFHLDDTSKMIEAVTNAQIEVRRYPTIEVTIDKETSFVCLNEFSVRSAIIKAFVMDIFIDDIHFERFRGDGMIVATPTGSTAYNKSVNGAIVDPLLPCMQVSELASVNNNHYRTLGSSFILSGDRKLTFRVVQAGNDYPIMGMDNEALSIQHVERFDVKLSNKIIKTVKLKDNSFWEKVKRTFL
ncbi:NAD kinase [Bacillus sp. REN3]|uniref:NAD kinase n=1 Tax=Bacillus sp. REN3 TaxID=2802440 RepID=UPI001AEE17DE|nr:NAD kinase [Bacillus sp. REN3]